MKVLVLDNYDSFVFNVARYLERLGARTTIRRNDETDLAAIETLAPDAIVISPGPCTPREAGISADVVRRFAGAVPILGICLGHQVIGDVYGGRVTRAIRPMHGRSSPMIHDGANLFTGLRRETRAGRYHSLIVEETPAMLRELSVDARSPEGEIMALTHRTHPVFGVQFHPESILTEEGETLLAAFLDEARTFRGDRPMTDRIWLGDRLVASDEACIDPGDRGFTLADGCFDTALCIDGRVFEGERHLDRLAGTCEALRLPIARDRLQDAQAALAGEIGNGSIRLTVTRGPGARGLALPADAKPTLIGTVAPLAPSLMFKPVTLAIAEARRNETSPTSRLKTLSYLDAILETERAKANGADDCLFFNTRGQAACSALANLFVIEGENIVTPPLADGVLDGVMRDLVLVRAAPAFGAGIASIPGESIAARGLLLTNSLRLVVPASIGPWRGFEKGAATRTIALMEIVCAAIRDECGTDPRDRGAVLPDLLA